MFVIDCRVCSNRPAPDEICPYCGQVGLPEDGEEPEDEDVRPDVVVDAEE